MPSRNAQADIKVEIEVMRAENESLRRMNRCFYYSCVLMHECVHVPFLYLSHSELTTLVIRMPSRPGIKRLKYRIIRCSLND